MNYFLHEQVQWMVYENMLVAQIENMFHRFIVKPRRMSNIMENTKKKYF